MSHNHFDPELAEIRDLNLAYLVLAQRVLRYDLAVGMYRLGVDEDCALLLRDFSFAQITKLAQSNVLLCRFRLDDYQVLSALNHSGIKGELLSVHASHILTNTQPDVSLVPVPQADN